MPSNKVTVRLRLEVKPLARVSHPSPNVGNFKYLIIVFLGVIGVIFLSLISRMGNDEPDFSEPTSSNRTLPTSSGAKSSILTPTPTQSIRNLTLGRNVSGRIDSVGETEEWFFTANEGETITIEMWEVGGLIDSTLCTSFVVSTPNGQVIDYDDYDQRYFKGVPAVLELDIHSFGTYTLTTKACKGSSRTTGAYELTVSKK